MADRLPKFVVLKSVPSGGYVHPTNENTVIRGLVRSQEESVFSPFVKIEVERAKVDKEFVHLRFCHTNKYWGRSVNDHFIVARFNQPEEDTSKSSCTLFEPTFGDDGRLYLTHVQSGGRLRSDNHCTCTGSKDHGVYVHDEPNGESFRGYAFTIVDWSTLVKLPNRVSFKGDNGKYLEYVLNDNTYHLQFSSNNGNNFFTIYDVQVHKDGHVRMKSKNLQKFWRRGSLSWVCIDSSDDSGKDKQTLFSPVKVDGRTIALQSSGNGAFCFRSTTNTKKTDYLNASVLYIAENAKLGVEEPVLERNIYNVMYRMEDARIYDEQPFVAASGTAINESDAASSLAIKVAYQYSSSYSFSNSLSVATGVETTFEAGLPSIVEGVIEISADHVIDSFEWGRKTTETKTIEATYKVKVPPRCRARVNYVGTHGKCSVPFCYTQRDKSSLDGQVLTSHHIDGIFSGDNYYNFRFELLAVEPL